MMIHVRNPLRRRGGSQWYKDTSERPSSAVCGGEMTDRDLAYPARQSIERVARLVTDELCESCRRIVAGRQGTFSWASRRRRRAR